MYFYQIFSLHCVWKILTHIFIAICLSNYIDHLFYSNCIMYYKYCIEMCQTVDSYFCFDRSHSELGRSARLVWYSRLPTDTGYSPLLGLCSVYYFLWYHLLPSGISSLPFLYNTEVNGALMPETLCWNNNHECTVLS